MSAITTAFPGTPAGWSLPYRGKVAMASLIFAESAIFTIFVVAYLFYVGKSLTGPTPQGVLETPIFFTICLLSSSLTVHFAGKSLERGKRGAFLILWLLTILLGGLFLYGTGREWHRLSSVVLTYSLCIGISSMRCGSWFSPWFIFLGAEEKEMATLASAEQMGQSLRDPREIEVPAPTAWPFVLAFGFTLLFTGLLTSVSVSVLGTVLALAGCVGWFKEVFPYQHEEVVPIVPGDLRITTERRVVERLPVAADQVRAWLPVETYPISAGVKGGLAGSVAMAVLACAYGVLKAGSIWYPINLLASAVYYQSLKMGPAQLNLFHADSFAIALILHALVSTLVGLLYGAMLPMFARRPIVLGGLIAPALWSGLLYTMLGLLNPMLASRIDWIWFMASQIAFGIVAGLVVIRHSRMPTRENLSFAMRAGVEAPGIMSRPESGEKHP